LRDQARAALARDARRREQRFVEAAQPGHLMATTRVEQRVIDAGGVDPDQLYQFGAQLFHHRFRRRDGFGAKDAADLRRVHAGRRGGPDAYRCADCHRRGGPAGAGDAADNSYLDGDGDDVTSALERNPPPLTGAGIVELLAREMSEELQTAQRALIARAGRQAARQRVELAAKGVSFGFLSATPDGAVDTRELKGVDPDLIIKPFGWKGHASTIREMVEDELLLHHGMQSDFLVEHAGADRMGRFGTPRGDGPSDPDGDGVVNEIREGQVTALTAFIAMQEVPQVGMPTNPARVADWTDGQQLFDRIGCAACHTPSLPLGSAVYRLASRQRRTSLAIDLATQIGRAHV
jgi:mono/diheme cytochrome c family protein